MTLDLSLTGAMTAFAAGAISFLSPCVLPLVPAYVSYFIGQNINEDPKTAAGIRANTKALIGSLCFVLGFSTIFIVLGAGISVLSAALFAYREQINLLSGALVMVFGAFMTGLWRPGWMERDTRKEISFANNGPISAYLLGIAFALGWSPCIGPILGAILGLAASSNHSSTGLGLLTIYSFGLGIPFILTAIFFERISTYLKKIRHMGRILQPISGLIMVAMGFGIMTGQLTKLAIWFLEKFPALGTIG